MSEFIPVILLASPESLDPGELSLEIVLLGRGIGLEEIPPE